VRRRHGGQADAWGLVRRSDGGGGGRKDERAGRVV
jgi:hypothetical protein